jgi:hypothetical protein
MRIAAVHQCASVILGAGAVDIHEAGGGRFGPGAADLYERRAGFVDWAAAATLPDPEPYAPDSLGSPSPTPRQVFGIGLNHGAHAAESRLRPAADRAAGIHQVPVVRHRPVRRAGRSQRARIALQLAEWQVIRLGGWTAGSGRCGWPGPVRPRPVPAVPGMSGSTGSGSSPRMPYGPVMRCGCVTKDANASWSSSGSSPSGPAHLLPPSAISTIALPLRPARRLSRWLPATAARAVRPSASAGVSRSCSGGRPAEPVSGALRKTGLLRRDRCPLLPRVARGRQRRS